MKTGDGAAVNADKAKREKLAGEDGAGAIDKLREGRQLKARVSEQNAERQQKDDSQLDEGAEIIARGEQQPHGQGASGEPVNNDGERESDAAPSEPDGPGGRLAYQLAAINAH